MKWMHKCQADHKKNQILNWYEKLAQIATYSGILMDWWEFFICQIFKKKSNDKGC